MPHYRKIERILTICTELLLLEVGLALLQPLVVQTHTHNGGYIINDNWPGQ